jgi:hypothetical protein
MNIASLVRIRRWNQVSNAADLGMGERVPMESDA